jgi:uncharacterized RDD family membrane protein YckC
LFDWILLSIPTLAVACIVAVISLLIGDQAGFHGIRTLLMEDLDEERTRSALADIAPLLVRNDAAGIPAPVRVAVEDSDFAKAGELLVPYELDFSLVVGGDPPPLKANQIRIDILELIPNTIRGIAVFGTAALYFTFLTTGLCPGTLGKRLFGIRVVRLDNRPLGLWESFERFGGYLASVGTFGFGLFDHWREPNRRLVHDRISNTVVIRHTR